MAILVFTIRKKAGCERFQGFTGSRKERLVVEAAPKIQKPIGLSQEQQLPICPQGNLLLMFGSIGSPGILERVLPGYTGYRSPPQQIRNMIEVPGYWRTYAPCNEILTRRDERSLIGTVDTLPVKRYDQGTLGYSGAMRRLLLFLEGFDLPLKISNKPRPIPSRKASSISTEALQLEDYLYNQGLRIGFFRRHATRTQVNIANQRGAWPLGSWAIIDASDPLK